MSRVWPFGNHAWLPPYTVELEYKTDILVSRNGKEQRRATRQTPRKTIRYAMSKVDDCWRELHAEMEDAQRTELVIPERPRLVKTATAMASGATTVTLPTLPTWIKVGAEVMLVEANRQNLKTITSVDITTKIVTFTTGVTGAWVAGSRLHPALRGYLNPQISGRIPLYRGIQELQLEFLINPGHEVEDVGVPGFRFEGKEFFTTRPDHWSAVELSHVQDGVSSVDFGFGRVKYFYPVKHNSWIWKAEWTGCKFDKTDELRKFFGRMKGQRGDFLMPSHQPDLVPLSGVTAGQKSLLVKGDFAQRNFKLIPGKLSLLTVQDDRIGSSLDGAETFIFCLGIAYKVIEAQVQHNGLELDLCATKYGTHVPEFYMQFSNCTSANVAAIRTGLVEAGSVSVNAELPAVASRATAWFGATATDTNIERRIFLLTGSAGSNEVSAAAIMADALDKNTGALSGPTAVDCHVMRCGTVSGQGGMGRLSNMGGVTYFPRGEFEGYFSSIDNFPITNKILDILGADHKFVAVKIKNVGWIIRRIATVAASGADTMIYFIDPWPATYPLSDIQMVSWVSNVRFASDILITDWNRQDIGTVTASIKKIG
jgi:hypothetical protein